MHCFQRSTVTFFYNVHNTLNVRDAKQFRNLRHYFIISTQSQSLFCHMHLLTVIILSYVPPHRHFLSYVPPHHHYFIICTSLPSFFVICTSSRHYFVICTSSSSFFVICTSSPSLFYHMYLLTVIFCHMYLLVVIILSYVPPHGHYSVTCASSPS